MVATLASVAHERSDPALTKRRWGYIVWGFALGFVFIPEILAAAPLTESQLPFPTISRTMGHLEFQNAAWTIVPTMLIVFVLMSLLRAPIEQTSGDNPPETVKNRQMSGERVPLRTPGGRLTVVPVEQKAKDFDNEPANGVVFAVRVAAIAIFVTALTLAAARHWPNQYNIQDGKRHKLPNYQVAYFLYGSIAFFWLLLPGLTGYIAGKDAYFPNLFRTIRNLEEWIAHPRGAQWVQQLLHTLAWLVSFILVWGMVFLLLHLTLYPFPNITHILNHNG
jgi:hypothetical protein